ncbi:MAG TPA: MFS transporter [Candidatus Elarobacter sp.]|jgi:predicted MFS family arabinose efflux permease|nr:MFS transporter [Candidatus Elarobacter sp.]
MKRSVPFTVLLVAAALIMSVALGARQSFGLFVGPIVASHAVSLPLLAFAIALQNLIWGIAQPFAGNVSDRFGPAPVVAAGAAAYAVGLAAVALHPGVISVMIGFGILVGVGLSGMTFAVVISAVSRAASDTQRATAVALAAAGGSLGQVALVPLAQVAIGATGFQRALIALACIAIAAAPLGFMLARRRAPNAAATPALASPTWPAIWRALRDRNYLFLTAGFFACGFQLAFIGVHLPTYLSMCHVAAGVGAASLATIGFFNIIGSFGFGKLMDRYEPQNLLAVLYTVRATTTLAFLATPPTALTTLGFAVLMGLTWLGTVPLTNGVVARLFGLGNLGTLFGVSFLSHQVGSFLGAWLGGVSLQLTGSYATVWIATVVVGYAAAAVNLPIRYRTAVATA